MMDLAGVGAILVGVAAVVGSLASAYMAIKNTKKIRDIDHAVNGKPLGAQTLQSQVTDLHSDRSPPPHMPPDVNGEALLPLVRLLVADMHQRRQAGEVGGDDAS